jgi:hypothetical protein
MSVFNPWSGGSEKRKNITSAIVAVIAITGSRNNASENNKKYIRKKNVEPTLPEVMTTITMTKVNTTESSK